MIYREKGVFGSEEIIQMYPSLYLTGQKDYTGCYTLNGMKQHVLGRIASTTSFFALTPMLDFASNLGDKQTCFKQVYNNISLTYNIIPYI